jgi:hypothetical protein
MSRLLLVDARKMYEGKVEDNPVWNALAFPWFASVLDPLPPIQPRDDRQPKYILNLFHCL